MKRRRFFISSENHHFLFLSREDWAINPEVDYFVARGGRREFAHAEAAVQSAKCLDFVDALRLLAMPEFPATQLDKAIQDARKIRFARQKRLRNKRRLPTKDPAAEKVVTPFEEDQDADLKELRRKILKSLNVKERMKVKNRELRQNLRLKKVKLQQLPHFKAFFDFAGNWLEVRPARPGSASRSTAEFRRMLQLEKKLNFENPLRPAKKLRELTALANRRHERFDPRSLFFGRRSRGDQGKRRREEAACSAWARTRVGSARSECVNSAKEKRRRTLGSAGGSGKWPSKRGHGSPTFPRRLGSQTLTRIK